MKRAILTLCIVLTAIGLKAQMVDFRGVNHCGIYPNEKNLLKEWPEGGPQKLWVVNDAGKGNSSALVSDGFIYTAGLTEDEQQEQQISSAFSLARCFSITLGVTPMISASFRAE